MSRQLKPIERVVQLIQFSYLEIVFTLLFTALFVGYTIAKTIPNIQPSLKPIESLFNSTVDQWKSIVPNILNDSSVATNILTLVVWGCIGGIVYILLWSVYAFLNDVKETHEVLYLDTHPSEYKTTFVLLDMLIRRLELVAASVGLAIYLYVWIGQILGNFATKITSLLVYDVKAILIVLYLVLIILSVHVFFVLIRIIVGQHHKMYSA